MWTRKATFAASDGNGVSESVQQPENIRRTVRGTTLVTIQFNHMDDYKKVLGDQIKKLVDET